MHLLAEPPFGPDAEAVADQQHPHHQLGIDGGATDRAIKWLQLIAQLVQIEHDIDLPQQMTGWDTFFQAEIVEQPLRRRLPPHHCAPPRISDSRKNGITFGRPPQSTLSTVSTQS